MSSQKPIIIPELLKELVYRLVQESNVPEEKRARLGQKCYLTSLKLIKAHIVSGNKESDIGNPLEDAHELLLAKGRSTQIHKLNRLYDRLASLSLAIPELNQRKSEIPNLIRNPGLDSGSGRFEEKVLRLLLPLCDGVLPQSEPENSRNSLNTPDGLQNPIETPVLSRFKDSSESSLMKRMDDKLSCQIQNAAQPNLAIVPSNTDQYSVPLYVLEKCLMSPTQELALVHDILYAMQGFEAQFVKYDISTDSFILLPSVYSLESIRTLVTEICRPGVLYRRMNLVLSQHQKQMEMPYFRERSLLTRTLVEFTQDLLSDYSQFVVSQQNEVQESLVVISRLGPGSNPNLELLSSDKPMLTLRKLLHRSSEQFHKNERIFASLEGLFGLTSSSILSSLNIQRHTGNQYHKKVFEELFHRCLTVWLEDLNMIMKFGYSTRYRFEDRDADKRNPIKAEVEQKLGELFVKGNLRDGIHTDESRVPNFLQLNSARRITHICETRVTIRHLLSKDQDTTFSKELDLPELTCEMVSDLNTIPLEIALNTTQRVMDGKLFEIVTKNGSLSRHLRTARDFLLCFNGDFFEMLILSIAEELEKPSDSVSHHFLEEKLEQTKENFPLFKENLKYLRILLQPEPRSESSGWDRFSLEYKIPEIDCSSLILDKYSLERYTQIFKVIWRLKSVLHRLNSDWIRLVKLLRTNELYPNSEDTISRGLGLLRQTSCLLRSLIMVLNSIKNLLCFSSIDFLWSSLEKEISNSRSIYDIRLHHNLYISQLESNLFISCSENQKDPCDKDSPEPVLNQELFLCLDLLLENSLFVSKVSKTLADGLSLFWTNQEQLTGNSLENLVSSLENEILESGENFTSCLQLFQEKLELLKSEKEEQLPFSHHSKLQVVIFNNLLFQLSSLNISQNPKKYTF
ncbi:gamma-tubulin complex component 3-like [Cryptosporidium felis]|nr:gamma-tubulin complex component 3-like [Cryptosporidium felis]